MNSKPLLVAIIPARYGSTRFPGKPLIEILGKTLIQRTYENTLQCPLLKEVIVATDDKRIYDHVMEFGGQAIMTPVDCPTGSDRLAYVIQQDSRLQQAAAIINVQGDEPCFHPQVLTQLIEALLSDPSSVMSTCVVKLEAEEAHDPSVVKCVLDLEKHVLYFSRALIPGSNTVGYHKKNTYYKHLGIYAYRPKFLLEYTKLPMTPLQIAEDLEQLKVLEHGYKIKAAIVTSASAGVNTPEDIKKVEKELCKQSLFS
jgi:3-deoxy-manno-octulosonate cytidylyltransferase (CMP-KDO synthetase)